MIHKTERRFIPATFEMRADGEKPPKLVGHAAVFGEQFDLGWMIETIDENAFDRALKEGQDVRAFFNHDPNYILGRTAAGTMKLSVDAKGLVNEITPPDTQYARDLRTSIERGDVTQQSIMFSVRSRTLTERDDGVLLRHILDVDLFEAGPVALPAYETTDITARSVEGLRAELAKELEEARKAPAHLKQNLEYLNRYLGIPA